MEDKTKQSDTTMVEVKNPETETSTKTESTEEVVQNKSKVKNSAEIGKTTGTVTGTTEAATEYNCSNCKGLGLVGNLEVAGRHWLCDMCGGTGKV